MSHSSKSVIWAIILICIFASMSGCCCCITGSGSSPSGTLKPATAVKMDVGVTPVPAPSAQAAGLGTIKNPVPVSVPYTYNPTATASNMHGSVAKITLLEVVKGEDANRRLKQINEVYEPASPATDDFLMARFRFEIEKADPDKTFIVNRHDFKASNNDGTKLYEPSYVTLDPALDGQVSSGNPIEGWIVLENGKADSAPMIVYDSGVDASGGVWFKTSP